MRLNLHDGWKAARRACAGDRGSQIVEFAVSMPLLIVIVVGIYDFSGAFTLKHQLTNIARESARAAAAAPASDLGNDFTAPQVPASVSDAFQVAQSYLAAEKINDCGLSPALAAQSGLSWTYSATGNGCPGTGLHLTINRGYAFPPAATQNPAGCPASGSNGVNLVSTCVSITYSYAWRFNSVITLLIPGAAYSGVSTLAETSVAFNEN
jgi:Flp pilus assembly protein TadG